MASRFLTVESEKEENQEYNCLCDCYSSDDDHVVKRVVKSMKEKISEELTNTTDEIKNAMKTHDFVSLYKSFEKMNKLLEKALSFDNSVPMIYINALIAMEKFVNQSLANQSLKWKMSYGNFKAMNVLRQKLKKKSKQFQELINKYKENPDYVQEEKDGDEDEREYESGPDEWENIMSGKAKLVNNEFVEESSNISWETVTHRFKEIVAEKREKKGSAGRRIKLLEQGKKGMGKIFVEPSQLCTRVHILSSDVNFSYVYYHE